MSLEEEEASPVIVVEGIGRLGESLFLEVEMSTTGSLPPMKWVCRALPSSSVEGFRGGHLHFKEKTFSKSANTFDNNHM